MTKGEYRVGISFNPSSNPDVDDIKRQASNLIDFIEGMETVAGGEAARLKSLAQTCFEEGAMWAVKAATKELFKKDEPDV